MTKKKTVAITQARMGSTRLPGKVLKPILGKPMLWHVVNRARRSKLIDDAVVATSKNSKDQEIVNFCNKHRIKVFQGPEDDVLQRYFLAAKKYKADIIVRITADCPLIDPEIIDRTIKKFAKGNFDYVAVTTGAGVVNKKIKKFPDGFDCEVFSFKTLERAYKQAQSSLEREHPTMFVWKNPENFKLGLLESEKDYSYLRFSVDYENDLKFVRKIYQKLYSKNPFFLLTDIIDLLKTNTNILLINQNNIGKEGYEKLWK